MPVVLLANSPVHHSQMDTVVVQLYALSTDALPTETQHKNETIPGESNNL